MMEKQSGFDAKAGKPDALAGLSPELREARRKAIIEGKLPEFDKEHGISNPSPEKSSGETAKPKERWSPTGKPESAFLAEAMRIKISNSDPRTAQEIAAELYKQSSDQERAA